MTTSETVGMMHRTRAISRAFLLFEGELTPNGVFVVSRSDDYTNTTN